ncbi:MAG: antibiotic biosynthesis monooxygenase [Solirubrobacterales bacterium]|nr:antibiotic biosynthesis monooxygenase [Solirubrobacterales bacterium]HMT04491.1 antibiotic biosynthesis monooxygenase [Solirubrobacterales bacterium]
MPDQQKISRYGKATAKSGKGGELAEILLEAAEANRAVEGCLQYEVHQSVFDPDTIWVTEAWVDQDAVKASLEDDGNRELIARARPLIEDMEVIELIPLGGIEARLDDPRAASPKPGYKLVQVEDVEDLAKGHGLAEVQEARFATGDLDASQVGVAWFRLHPNQRQPFGHHHNKAEEVYFIIAGSGRAKLDDEMIDLTEGSLLRVAPEIVRGFEAGPEGMTYLATGQKMTGDGEIQPGWWTD